MNCMGHFEAALTLFITLLVLVGVNAFGQRPESSRTAPSKGPVPPPVATTPASSPAGPVYVYDQKPLPGRPVLVQPQQAQAIIDKFKAAYPRLGSPRMLIYINRDLVDENTGLRLIARTEKTDATRTQSKSDFKLDPNYKGGADTNGVNIRHPGQGSTSSETEKSSYENRHKNNERKEATLADRQTVRDVERLFGRPLRMAGVGLSDQRLATQLIADHPLKPLNTEGEQARKDREALANVADVVVEVLISSRNIQTTDVSGDKIYAIPDIQATALRLKDSRILGQAASSDITGKERNAGYYARNFDVREIAEATALALMEDMLTGVDTARRSQIERALEE